jgi:hypothetical protein
MVSATDEPEDQSDIDNETPSILQCG